LLRLHVALFMPLKFPNTEAITGREKTYRKAAEMEREITSGCSKCAVPQIKWCPKNQKIVGPPTPETPDPLCIKKKASPKGGASLFYGPYGNVWCFVPFCILPLKMKRKAAWGAHIKHRAPKAKQQNQGAGLPATWNSFYWNLFSPECGCVWAKVKMPNGLDGGMRSEKIRFAATTFDGLLQIDTISVGRSG